MTIKEKIQKFFKIPEKIFEEEPQRIFEKVKLFTLTRTKLFLAIIIFFLIVNVLVIFDLNQFCLRAIIAFIFIIIIPGLLILLGLKVKNIGFWEFFVYTVGLSISFIMFAGLAVNWILPFFGITEKPLSTFPILIFFDIFLVILGIIAEYRNRDLKYFNIIVHKIDSINNIFFIIPILFPALAILGAFVLNNNGPNTLIMVMLGFIACYILCIVLFRKKVNEHVYPWAILMISSSILLSWWLRSWYVSGIDSNLEFLVFQLTKNSSLWSINNYNNAYNAMLSLTILPTILSNFLKINDQFVFKFLFQVMFSFVPVVMFLIFKRFIKNNALIFLGVFFFIIQPYFIAIQMRQEIAFLFLSLLLLIILENELKIFTHKLFFIIFGASMIVSHYSTSYIAITLLLIINFVNLIYKKWKR